MIIVHRKKFELASSIYSRMKLVAEIKLYWLFLNWSKIGIRFQSLTLDPLAFFFSLCLLAYCLIEALSNLTFARCRFLRLSKFVESFSMLEEFVALEKLPPVAEFSWLFSMELRALALSSSLSLSVYKLAMVLSLSSLLKIYLSELIY